MGLIGAVMGLFGMREEPLPEDPKHRRMMDEFDAATDRLEAAGEDLAKENQTIDERMRRAGQKR